MARPDILIDSNIIIDILLGRSLALQWASQHKNLEHAITSITVMEVLRGARTKIEMDQLGRALSRFVVLHMLQQDSLWAVRQFRAFWLSHQIGMNDCLIAAIAARMELPFYTLNLKDFTPLLGVQAIRPY